MDYSQVETVFFGPMVGELGWACSRWHAWCRYRRFTEFANCKSIAMDYDWRYPLYSDFIDEFIPIPKWITDLGWEQDCYELIPPGSPPGGCMPVDIYTDLINYCKQYYNPATTWEVRTPRGCNFIVQQAFKQMWKQLEPSDEALAYVDSLLHNNKRPLVVFSGRKRARSADRNVPEHIWDELIDFLTEYFTVVITGTKHSSALVNKVGRNIINVIPRTGVDGLDVLIAFFRRARFSITSQSGPTLISLLCETPSYVVGHESARHSKWENFLQAACMFRTVPGAYGALNVEDVKVDIQNFNFSLETQIGNIERLYAEAHGVAIENMVGLMSDQHVEFYNVDLPTLQQEIYHADTR